MSGRAGRDGNEAHIHLLFGKGDVSLNTELLHGIAPDHDEMAQIYRSLRLRCLSFRMLDGITGTGCGSLVTSEDTYNTLCDVVLSDGLGLRCITFAVLGLHKLIALSFECRAEACFSLNGGVCCCVYVYDTDLTGCDACCLESLIISSPAVLPAASLSVEKVASASTFAGESTYTILMPASFASFSAEEIASGPFAATMIA